MAIQAGRLSEDVAAQVSSTGQSDQRDATVLGQIFRPRIRRASNYRTVCRLPRIFANYAHCLRFVHRHRSRGGTVQIRGQVKDEHEIARYLARTGTRSQSRSDVKVIGGARLLVLLSGMTFFFLFLLLFLPETKKRKLPVNLCKFIACFTGKSTANDLLERVDFGKVRVFVPKYPISRVTSRSPSNIENSIYRVSNYVGEKCLVLMF